MARRVAGKTTGKAAGKAAGKPAETAEPTVEPAAEPAATKVADRLPAKQRRLRNRWSATPPSRSTSARAAARNTSCCGSPTGTASSPARPGRARRSPSRSSPRVSRAPASRSSPPTSRAISPASPRWAQPRSPGPRAPRRSGSRSSRISSRWCSGTCSESRAIRSVPRCPRWGRCCFRGCSISTIRRKACSTSPSASPTSRASCCSTSRICARCSAMSPTTPRS